MAEENNNKSFKAIELPSDLGSFDVDLLKRGLDMLGICVIALTTDHKIRYANRFFIELSGYALEQLVDRDFIERFVPQGMGEKAKTVFNSMLEQGRLSYHEATIVTRSGELRCLAWNSTLFRGWHGQELFLVFGQDVTERKVSDEALRKSEQRYRLLLENASDSILIADVNGKMLDANPKFLELLDRPLDYLKREGAPGFITHENLKHSPLRIAEVMQGKVVRHERELRRSDGRVIPVEITASRIDENTFQASIRDISERRQAEEALRRSEAKYRQLMEQASDAILVYDSKGRITDVNQAACQLAGRLRNELIGKLLTDLHRADDRELHQQNFKRVLRGERILTEAVIAREDGSSVQVEINAKRLGEDRVLAVIRDITKRREAEEALRQSEERYRTTIDALDDIVHVADRDLRIVLCNEALERVASELGFSATPVGAKISEVFPFIPEKALREYRAVFENGEPQISEEFTETEDRQFWTETSKIPIHDSLGQVQRVITIIRDITERKRMERALTAEAKIEGLEILAGGISRRLAEQMSVILGHSAVAKSILPTDDRVYRSLEAMEEAGRSVMRMAEQLKYISAEPRAHPRLFDVTRLIEDLLPELNKTIDPVWEVKLKINSAPAPVRLDSGMFEQALLSLMINARQAAPRADSAEMIVDMIDLQQALSDERDTIPPGRYVTVEIIDHGPPIDSRALQTLFMPFTIDRRGQRHGVGLSMVYGIVKSHSGYVRATSRRDAGNCVTIYLPAAENLDLRREQLISGGLTCTVLLAHAKRHMSGMLQSVLTRAGYSVIPASNAREAIEAVEQQGPIIDIVLLDLGLPHGSAQQVLHAVGELRPELALIAIRSDSVVPTLSSEDEARIHSVLPSSSDAVAVLEVLDLLLEQQTAEGGRQSQP
ncbi:MAG: PAS domain S-box protein [Candidatus Alcyoniella australis]|nr:PAS domain S-box protein [Candidatus Alcyoniella australis]